MLHSLYKGWRTLVKARAHGNFEEKNKALEATIISISYYIIRVLYYTSIILRGLEL